MLASIKERKGDMYCLLTGYSLKTGSMYTQNKNFFSSILEEHQKSLVPSVTTLWR
jgi:hypothetical protein